MSTFFFTSLKFLKPLITMGIICLTFIPIVHGKKSFSQRMTELQNSSSPSVEQMIPSEDQRSENLDCIEEWKDKYYGAISVGFNSTGSSSLLSISHYTTLRNKCKKNFSTGKEYLVRFLCNPTGSSKPYSFEELECLKGCKYSESEGSALCIKQK